MRKGTRMGPNITAPRVLLINQSSFEKGHNHLRHLASFGLAFQGDEKVLGDI
jgi:hypothetical protein